MGVQLNTQSLFLYGQFDSIAHKAGKTSSPRTNCIQAS
uniref:Uncharacterized protein n=1 Tax=Arundo donax TaxID=35708 RepID=A0A0A9F4G2_ARUDO